MAVDTGMHTEFRRYQMLVGGRWIDSASGKTFTRTSPADGSVVGEYPEGTADDAERAIAAARKTFDETGWPTSPARERARIMNRAAELLRERQAELGRRISLELGKPLRLAVGEVLLTAEVLEYYAALAQDLRGEAVTQHVPDALGIVAREPVGVVGMITPWNFPMLLLSWKVAPALAAGCTMVAKPSVLTPGSALDLGQVLLDAGLPAGVYNVVTGKGSVVGNMLAASHDVDKVAFTGSTEVGRSVLAAAAGNLKKVTLELGGKSPNIIFPDADVKAAVRGAYWGIFLNSGQACQAGSRLLVHQDFHDAFMEELLNLTRTSRLGDPLDEKTMLGPLVDQGQMNTVLEYIQSGRQEGAVLLHGGERVTEGEFGRGCYVQPTIFDAVQPEMTIAREEIFGPVLSVMTFRDVADAVRLANQTCYGLAGAVWTRDLNTALQVAKGVRAGTVWVNAYYDAGIPFSMPMGGYRQSGIGRELGREGLLEYLETKSIQIKLHVA